MPSKIKKSSTPRATKQPKGKNPKAKRPLKSVKDRAEAVATKGAMRRLCRRGGVKRVTAIVLPEFRAEVMRFVRSVVTDACAYTELAKRTTVTAQDVVNALRKRGKQLYGYT